MEIIVFNKSFYFIVFQVFIVFLAPISGIGSNNFRVLAIEVFKFIEVVDQCKLGGASEVGVATLLE